MNPKEEMQQEWIRGIYQKESGRPTPDTRRILNNIARSRRISRVGGILVAGILLSAILYRVLANRDFITGAFGVVVALLFLWLFRLLTLTPNSKSAPENTLESDEYINRILAYERSKLKESQSAWVVSIPLCLAGAIWTLYRALLVHNDLLTLRTGFSISVLVIALIAVFIIKKRRETRYSYLLDATKEYYAREN